MKDLPVFFAFLLVRPARRALIRRGTSCARFPAPGSPYNYFIQLLFFFFALY